MSSKSEACPILTTMMQVVQELALASRKIRLTIGRCTIGLND